ncbi:unnamed protein product [Tenebrio molitor]|nr:unnamed protein product [Tenebrio molitor]
MLKTYQKLRFNKIYLIKHISPYSNQPVPKEKTDEHYEQQLKEFQKISNIQQKVKTKKPQKPPFVKNLFLGIFDTDILTYPELKNEELDNLNKIVQEAQTVLEKPEVKECKQISRQFLKKLGAGQILGQQASQLMGGRELNAMETCRLTEAISEIDLKNVIVNNEKLGIQLLVKFGSDHLKRKYLQKLIDGDSLSAFCVVEPLPTNLDIFKKTAMPTSGGKTWILNGEKKMVLNGSDADIYIVFANTNHLIKDEVREQKFTAFVVERDFGGVTSSRHKTLDNNLELSDVVFENTPIPAENIIGSEGQGDTILSGIYPEHRLSTGPVCSSLVKKLINRMTQHYINVSKEPHLLYETDAVRMKLGELTASLYAIESMVYLTAGLIDEYENQDTELETAIVKVFASEQALLSTTSCINFLGPEATLDSHWCSKLHTEALSQVALNDHNDNLKILIALFGMRHVGQETNDLIRKLRNPFFYSTFVLKRMWTHRRHFDDNPKLNLYLHHYLHPSSINASNRLEYCVLRLQHATETLLSRYGQEVINKHADLTRLAECIMDIYAMTACISRASRSYCIGLQSAEYEMALASAIAMSATERVKANLLKVIEGPYMTNDENYRVITQRLFDFKKYYPTHPLTRNF